MRLCFSILAVFTACGTGEPDVALTLDGPAEVRVEALGPVPGPRVVDAEGEPAEGVAWSVSPGEVARIDDGGVVAVGPGEALVTGVWRGQRVQWRLVVDPEVVLRFRAPPARVAVGEEIALSVDAIVGGRVTASGPITWSVRPPEGARLVDGALTGVRPGVVWVSARLGDAEAMAEIEVVP